jgi:murein DD-endopeptidase MepM/ murein hydrolase activator NlpD
VTRYGHLRGFAAGVHAGARVTIAQTVAYVGTTGLSTGPHLHFEVLVGGSQVDSRTALRTTAGEPLARRDLGAFEQRKEQWLAMLAGTPGVVRLATR